MFLDPPVSVLEDRNVMHVQMTSFVNVCDVKSAEKRYACLKIVNNKTKRIRHAFHLIDALGHLWSGKRSSG